MKKNGIIFNWVKNPRSNLHNKLNFKKCPYLKIINIETLNDTRVEKMWIKIQVKFKVFKEIKKDKKEAMLYKPCAIFKYSWEIKCEYFNYVKILSKWYKVQDHKHLEKKDIA